MWILKGVSLGAGLFFLGSFLFLIMWLRPFASGMAIGLSAIAGITILNPFFWVALVACLALGVSIVGSWPVRA
jgi:hypothetical protein